MWEGRRVGPAGVEEWDGGRMGPERETSTTEGSRYDLSVLCQGVESRTADPGGVVDGQGQVGYSVYIRQPGERR
jgi:hypothetical protein